jgi:hypothetical protein
MNNTYKASGIGATIGTESAAKYGFKARILVTERTKLQTISPDPSALITAPMVPGETDRSALEPDMWKQAANTGRRLVNWARTFVRNESAVVTVEWVALAVIDDRRHRHLLYRDAGLVAPAPISPAS